MTLSTIISIAISLTFIYLASSLVISEIQEIISSLLKLRAKNLKESIYGLLGEEQPKGQFLEKMPITEKLYEKYLKLPLNPSLASNLQQQKLEGEKPEGKQLQKSREPEKIPAQQFVADLIELVREELKYQDGDFYKEHELTKVVKDLNSPDCHLPEKMKRDLSAMARKAINRFSSKQEQLKALDQEIQSWFNTSMEYASEIYRRKSIILSRILAVIVVLMFNIDTVNIIDNLSKSEVLSSTLSNTIMQVVDSNSGATSCSQVNDQTQFQDCISNIQDELAMALDGIDNLPIGWNFSAPLKKQFTPLNFPHVLEAVTGWIISAIAISMGAPFWYRVLNNLINIKSNQSARNQS